MPGTLVHDAGQTKLHDAVDISGTGTTTGSAVQVNRPGTVRVMQTTAAVTGTGVTAITEIQGCDSSGFGSGVVSYGKFPAITDTDDNETHFMLADIQHKYVRAVTVTAGTTPVVNDLTVTLEERRYHRTKTDSAG